jgi:hypothetical protein
MDDLQLILSVFVGLVLTASVWRIFSKADEPGWASIVPIYNIYVLHKICGKPAWWIILYFVPIANLIVTVSVSIALAQKFGKETGYGIGLAFLGFIFYPLLAFTDAQYEKPFHAKAA